MSSHVQWLPYALTLADMRFDGDGRLMNMIMMIMVKNIKPNYNENNNKNCNYDNNDKVILMMRIKEPIRTIIKK